MTTKLIHRVLLTNDDGIDAPGMAILKDIAAQLAEEVWVVAPVVDQSGVSNAVSLKSPFRVNQRSEREFAIYGTPADCANFALKQAMKDNLPDLVLSGINNGSNLGFETLLSGTVGGAMTATVSGFLAIALSQVTQEGSGYTNWSCAKQHGLSVIQKLVKAGWPKQTCINVNFPKCNANEVQGIKITTQGRVDVSGLSITPTTDPENNVYYWFRALHGDSTSMPERELDAVNLNYIAITPITYERTDYLTYESLQAAFSCKQ